MPKAITLVPITLDDEPVAAGLEVDLSDEEYADMRADGKVAASEAETKAGQQEAGPEGVYNARTGREDVAATEEAPAAKAEAKSKKA